jgi:drug/metabolite transporter (DMT)-like permease
MVAAGFFFTVMVGLVKVVRVDMSAFDVILWRGAVAAVLAWFVARPAGYVIVRRRLLLLRIVLGFSAMTCFFTAAKGLPLTDLTLISKLQPIVIALLAPILLREGSAPAVWGLMLLGLAGGVLVVSPELAGDAERELRWGLWAVAASVFSALAHMCVRALGHTEDPRILVFWFQVAVVPLAVAALFVTQGGPTLPAPSHWLPLAGIGAFATAGQLCMTLAYKAERAALVGAASYTSPVWGLLGDVLFFAALPGLAVLGGGVLIVAAGLGLVFLREAKGEVVT